jgi:hypothetical protein
MADISDTSPEAEQILIDGYRAMPPLKKLRCVSQMTLAIQEMALIRIRNKYGNISEREEKLRLASLWIDRETMIKVFDWDPETKGY